MSRRSWTPLNSWKKLAAIEHERWAHWQQYMHDQCRRADDESLIIPHDSRSDGKPKSTLPMRISASRRTIVIVNR